MHPDPSTMFVPIVGDSLPDYQQVRDALHSGYPQMQMLGGEIMAKDVVAGEELVPGGPPWLLSISIPGFLDVISIWPELVDEFPEEAWWNNQELSALDVETLYACHYGLVIETSLDNADPRLLWQRQLSLAHFLGETLKSANHEISPAIYDENAMKLLSMAYVKALARMPIAPSAFEMISLHAVYDEDDPERIWLHSHGMNRAGGPDIEALSIHREHHALMAHVIAMACDRMLDGVIPADEGALFLAAPDVYFEMVDLDEALDELDEDTLGHDADRDDLHFDRRVVFAIPKESSENNSLFLKGKKRSFALDSALLKMNRSDMIYYTEQETERQTFLAHYRYPYFLQLWYHKTEEAWLFLVKTAYETPDEISTHEHVWIEVEHIDTPEEIEGKLVNEPIGIEGMHIGDSIRIQAKDINDWSISTPEGVYSPHNIVRFAVMVGIQADEQDPIH